jgi:hypothetical protein
VSALVDVIRYCYSLASNSFPLAPSEEKETYFVGLQGISMQNMGHRNPVVLPPLFGQQDWRKVQDDFPV